MVEQMKTKARGTWSLADIIDEVLPDLFKAIPDCDSDREVTRAVFVSNAGKGNWPGELSRLFGFDSSTESPKTGYPSLDDVENLNQINKSLKEKLKKKGCCPTALGLFTYIARRLAGKETADLDAKTLRRVEMLLRIFEFEKVSTESLKKDLEFQLRNRVQHEEDLNHHLEALLGDFLERGQTGEPFESKALLVAHRLAGVDLSDHGVLIQLGRDVLQRYADSKGYEADLDVRPGSGELWSHESTDEDSDSGDSLDTRPLPRVLHGESGQGKTWRLLSEALSLADRQRLVIFVEAATDRQTTLDRVAAVFCNEIWHHDAVTPLERLHDRLQGISPRRASDWLDLMIDGVQSAHQVEELLNYKWSRLGIRLTLALTTTSDDLPSGNWANFQPTPIGDFSTHELRRYLDLHLGESRALAVDYSRRFQASILYRPLFARLFCDLANSWPSFQPDSEIELLHAYWTQQLKATGIALTRLAQLASELPEGRAYPWSLATLDQARIDEDSLKRLLCSGILRLSMDGRSAEVFHHRLFVWVIAEGLAQAARDGRLSPEELAERVSLLVDGNDGKVRWGGLWLGHVYFDLLWLLLNPQHRRLEEAFAVVTQIRTRRLENLGFLGGRAIPLLLRVARDHPRNSRSVAEALVSATEGAQLSAIASDLLNEEVRDLRLLGARLLQRAPIPEAMAELWQLRCEMVRDAQPHWVNIHDAVDNALFACCRGAGDWLRATIRQAGPGPRPIAALIYLLPSTSDGREIWLQLKSHILEIIPEKEERCIAQCMEAFRDAEDIPWLELRVQQRDDYVGAAARRALLLVDPGRPIEPLPGQGQFLRLARNWWLLPHIHRDAEQVAAFLKEEISRIDDPWLLASTLLAGFENHTPPAVLEQLLFAAPRLFPTKFEAGAPRPFLKPARFLDKLFQMELVTCLEAQAGQELEEKLGLWLMEEGPNNSRGHSWDLEAGVALLKRIGGDAIQTVAKRWLRKAETWWAAKAAIELAILRPDSEIEQLLLKLATRDQSEPTEHPIAQTTAITALLQLDRVDLAVEASRKWAHKISRDTAALLSQSDFPRLVVAGLREAVDGSDPPIPNEAFLLALGRQAEDAERLHQILQDPAIDSEVARMALLGLYQIEDGATETQEAYLRHISNPETEYVCVLGLLQHRTEAALDVLNRLMLASHGTHQGRDHASLIAINLLAFEDTKEATATKLWQNMEKEKLAFMVSGRLDALFLYGGPKAENWIEDLAFSQAGSFDRDPTAAIRALVEHRPKDGFEAASRRFEQDSSHLEIPDLLLTANPEKGLDLLREKLPSLVSGKDFELLAAVGEAITERLQQEVLTDWLDDPDPLVRQGTCILAEVCPWSEPLQKALENRMDDEAWDVREAVNKALEALWRSKEHDRLVDTILQEPDPLRQKRLLEIALETGYPGVSVRQPWVASLVEALDFPQRIRMKEVLKKRRKDLRAELKKRK